MRPRFFAPDLDPQRSEVTLSRDEAHHLTRVLRLGLNDAVAVFDGGGVEFAARVASADRAGVRLALVDRIETRETRVALTLVQSVLKAEGMDGVVRDGTMFGVRRIQPVISERTTVKASTLEKGVERWRRIALASLKQSGGARLPEIVAPEPFDAWLRGGPQSPSFLLLEPDQAVPGMLTARALVNEPTPSNATIIVGPEGGWTAEERDAMLAAACRPLSLGPLTLRADAVPLAACATLLAIWEG